jgi:hypothetical protein
MDVSYVGLDIGTDVLDLFIEGLGPARCGTDLDFLSKADAVGVVRDFELGNFDGSGSQ